MEKIMILGASEFQVPVIIQAKKMGLYTIVVDINPNAKGAEYADEFYVESIKNQDAILELAKKTHPNGITVGMCDVAVCSAALVCRELNLPGLSYETALVATNKYKMIKAFEKNGVPHPKYFETDKDGGLMESINIPFPLIVKPVDMAGSRGVNKINNQQEFEELINDSKNASDSGRIIVQEYMEGPEVSVELLVKDGEPMVMQITDKYTSGEPHFMEVGHSQPCQLGDEICAEIRTVAVNAAKAIGLINSLAHAEIIITKQGPKMVEIGARMGGDGIQEQLLYLSKNINVSELAINIAMGYPFDFPQNCAEKASCIKFIQASDGIVVGIENVEQACKLENVYEVSISCVKGKEYENAKDNSGRWGHIISVADSVDEAIDICEKAYNLINFTVIKK